MAYVGGGKGVSKKICGNCRYFIQRRLPTNGGLFSGVSKYGFCDGNKSSDLLQDGIPNHFGLVHRAMECRLPCVGKPADFKPKFHVPAGMKQAKPYSAHPNRIKQFESREDKYNREWHIERLEELNERR